MALYWMNFPAECAVNCTQDCTKPEVSMEDRNCVLRVSKFGISAFIWQLCFQRSFNAILSVICGADQQYKYVTLEVHTAVKMIMLCVKALSGPVDRYHRCGEHNVSMFRVKSTWYHNPEQQHRCLHFLS
jgi:hypothetical protein